jgi:hypothetical protein
MSLFAFFISFLFSSVSLSDLGGGVYTYFSIFQFCIGVILSSNTITKFLFNFCVQCSVKRVDEVVRYPHHVTQDQFSLVAERVLGIPEDNFTTNIKFFNRILHVSNFSTINTFPTSNFLDDDHRTSQTDCSF